MDRGDLILPAILAERRLTFIDGADRALEVGLRVDQQLAASGRRRRNRRATANSLAGPTPVVSAPGRRRSFRHWLLRYRDLRDGAITLRRIRYALIFAAAVFGRHRHPAQQGTVFGVTGANRLRRREIAVGIERFGANQERTERDERDQRLPTIADEDPAAITVDADAASVAVGELAGLSRGPFVRPVLPGLAKLAELARALRQAGFAKLAGALRQAGLAKLAGALRQAGLARSGLASGRFYPSWCRRDDASCQSWCR